MSWRAQWVWCYAKGFEFDVRQADQRRELYKQTTTDLSADILDTNPWNFFCGY